MENLTKNRYSDSELQEFKEIIKKKIERVDSQLRFYREQIDELKNSTDNRVKGLDDGISATENEQIMQMIARAKKHKQHLENALVRIENKTYGICRITGKLISKERLKAVPHATLSIEAKNMK